MRQFYVYILTSDTGTLYTGVTNNLARRMDEHKQGIHEGFTQRYKVIRLAYCSSPHHPRGWPDIA
jgi:putative endonuclease